jgi:hypothetical protein
MSFGKMKMSGEYPQKEIRDKNLREFIPKDHFSNLQDLSECIFGCNSIDEENFSGKGRVQFSHAFCNSPDLVQELPLKRLTLAGPKPSYYPIYLKQDEDKKNKGKVQSYKTYDNESILKGWKKYPVHSEFILPPDSVYKTENEEKKQASLFIAIKKCVFIEKIKFHNLKKAEIGALLSAITFHGTDECFHSAGSAKAYGYGKLKLSTKFIGNYSINEYLKSFEEVFKKDRFNQFVNFNFKESVCLKEIILMAQEHNNQADSQLKYMSLDKKEFMLAKKNREFLNNYSKLSNIQLKSRIGESEKILIELKMKKKREEEELLQKEQIKKLQLEQERIQREAEEKRLQEERIEAERLKLETEEKARQEKRQKEVEAGLSFLENIKDFDGSRGRIDQWLKKAGLNQLPEEQLHDLKSALTRFYNSLKTKEQQKWKETFDKNAIWKKIASWVGIETAQKWYNEIIKPG